MTSLFTDAGRGSPDRRTDARRRYITVSGPALAKAARSGQSGAVRSSVSTLVVVSGPAGCGKTTLAHRLARALACPAICRDEIKEGMARTANDYLPEAGDELARRTLSTFFDVLRLLVERGTTVVAEAAFQDHVWTPNLAPLAAFSEFRVVQCHTDPATAMRRVAEHAATRRMHADKALLGAIERGDRYFADFRRVAIEAPMISVDTTDGYKPSVDEVVAFIETR